MDIITKLLNGNSLYVCMSPNEYHQQIPKYKETWHLPYVIMQDGKFWGKSQTGHAGGYSDTIYHPNTFAYTNAYEVFTSFDNYNVQILNRKLYETFSFKTENNYSLLYENGTTLDINILDSLLFTGTSFKVALQDESDKWYIYPVGQLHKYNKNADLEIHTSMDFFPEFCTEFTSVESVINLCPKQFGKNINYLEMKLPELAVQLKNKNISTYMKIYTDGCYQSLTNSGLSERKSYKNLKLFYARDKDANN